MNKIKSVIFMTIFIFIAAFSVSLVNAEAGQSPAARNCRIAGGQTWLLNVGSSDDLELCIFGKAMISSETLYNYSVLGTGGRAIQVYLQNKNGSKLDAESYCQKNAGKILFLPDSEDCMYSICKFSDNSSMDAYTIVRGVNAAENLELSAAIKDSSR